MNVRVVNLGVGGERTDQALRRLDAVAEHRPRVVTVMYGTNDSYVDQGKTQSRLTVEDYRANLEAIVAELLLRGIEPILMTEPRWAADAPHERARREPERTPRPLHGGVSRGSRGVSRAAGRPFRAGPTRNRKGSRSATGPPTVATRTRAGTASSPTRCCPCSSRRSGPTRDPSRSRPGSTPCSSTTTASSSGTTRVAAIRPEAGRRRPGVADDAAEAPAARPTTTRV